MADCISSYNTFSSLFSKLFFSGDHNEHGVYKHLLCVCVCFFLNKNCPQRQERENDAVDVAS